MNADNEKHGNDGPSYIDPEDRETLVAGQNVLHRDLQGRHMQMIAIGGAIGAGLFVSSGGAFQSGGPGSVLLGFLIVGGIKLCNNFDVTANAFLLGAMVYVYFQIIGRPLSPSC